MTHSDLVLDRLSRLERTHDGPIPAPLRAWALGAAPQDRRAKAIAGIEAEAAHYRTQAQQQWTALKTVLRMCRGEADRIRRDDLQREAIHHLGWVTRSRENERDALKRLAQMRPAPALPLAAE